MSIPTMGSAISTASTRKTILRSLANTTRRFASMVRISITRRSIRPPIQSAIRMVIPTESVPSMMLSREISCLPSGSRSSSSQPRSSGSKPVMCSVAPIHMVQAIARSDPRSQVLGGRA